MQNVSRDIRVGQPGAGTGTWICLSWIRPKKPKKQNAPKNSQKVTV